ncbi:MAG: rare lipoprotein A [Sulfurimonas sp.]|jgi:rare lipoprotein A|uniref:septal ring lytic transglycosylase RlpA family protein n=1 Tax=Sulfurimonas sp. TaxID=2022749 RepID=UPI0039E49097
MNKFFLLSLVALLILATGCSRKSRYVYSKYDRSNVRTYSANKSHYNTGLSAKAYKHPTFNPYRIRGIKYYPHDTEVGTVYKGNASWYGPDFHGKLTSNGERYNMYDMTAAHKTLPMNTVVKVINRNNGLTAVVRINDRGPFISTRIIDLSNSAARKIKMVGAGVAPVSIEVLGFYSKNKKRIIRKKATKKPNKVIIPKKVKKTADGSYSLQIASFSNIDGAIKIQEKYDQTDGYATVIKDIQTENGRFFKVYLRGFNTAEEARSYKSYSEFENAFIVKD